MKYAILEQLRNPPNGFEEIIRLHFFFKKEEILNDCLKFINEAKE